MTYYVLSGTLNPIVYHTIPKDILWLKVCNVLYSYAQVAPKKYQSSKRPNQFAETSLHDFF